MIDWNKIKENAKKKDEATYIAETTDYAKVKNQQVTTPTNNGPFVGKTPLLDGKTPKPNNTSNGVGFGVAPGKIPLTGAKYKQLSVPSSKDKMASLGIDFKPTTQSQINTVNGISNKTITPTPMVQDKVTDTDIERGFYALGNAISPNKANTVGSGLRYDLARGVTGAVGAVEGVTDFVVGGLNNVGSTITSLGGTKPNAVSQYFDRGAQYVYDNDVSGAMRKGIEDKVGDNKNWSSNITGELWEMAGNIIAVGGIGKAAPELAKVSAPVLSKAIFGVSQGGNSAQQAYNEGATSMQAAEYGTVIAAATIATESMFGGVPMFGKGVLDDIIKGLDKSPKAVQALVDMVGEGGEEAVQTYITPYLQRIYYNPEAKNATINEMLTSFAYGAGLSGIMQAPSVIGSIGAKPNAPADNVNYTAQTGANNVQNVPNNMQNQGQNVQNTIAPNLVKPTPNSIPQSMTWDEYKGKHTMDLMVGSKTEAQLKEEWKRNETYVKENQPTVAQNNAVGGRADNASNVVPNVSEDAKLFVQDVMSGNSKLKNDLQKTNMAQSHIYDNDFYINKMSDGRYRITLIEQHLETGFDPAISETFYPDVESALAGAYDLTFKEHQKHLAQTAAAMADRIPQQATQAPVSDIKSQVATDTAKATEDNATQSETRQAALSDGEKVVAALSTERGTAPTWDDITAYAKQTGDTAIIGDVNTAIQRGEVEVKNGQYYAARGETPTNNAVTPKVSPYVGKTDAELMQTATDNVSNSFMTEEAAQSSGKLDLWKARRDALYENYLYERDSANTSTPAKVNPLFPSNSLGAKLTTAKAVEVDTAEQGKPEVQIEPEYTSASDGEQTWTIIKNLSDVRSAVKNANKLNDPKLMPKVPVTFFAGKNMSMNFNPFPGVAYRGASASEFDSFVNTGKTGGFWTGDPSSAFTGNSPDRVLFVGKENIPYDSVKHIEDNGSRTSENVYAVLSKVDSNNIDGTLSGWKVIWKNPSFKLSEIGFPDNQSVSDTAPATSLFPSTSLGAKITSGMPQGTGAVEAGFDKLGTLVDKYGAIPEGENPHSTERVTEERIPKQTADDDKVSQTARTAYEAPLTTNETAEHIEEAVLEKLFSYKKATDRAALEEADKTIADKGVENALSDWREDIRAGKVTKKLSALGWKLYNEASKAGNGKRAVEILVDITNMTRNAAQTQQAASLLKKMSPEYQLYAVQRSVQRMNDQIAEVNEKRNNKISGEERRKAKTAAEDMSKAVKEESKKAADDVVEELTQSTKKQVKKKTGLTDKQKLEIKQATQDAKRKHGVPVEDWADETGRLLAEGVSKTIEPQNAPKDKAITQIITDDIKKFVGTIPKPIKTVVSRNAIDTYTDFMENRQYYTEAWAKLQADLKAKYANNPEALKAIDTIINRTADTAATDYYNKQLDGMINKALKSINVKLSELVTQGDASKESILKSVTDILINESGIDSETAKSVSQNIADRFSEMLAERSTKRLNSMFPSKIRGDASEKQSLENKLEGLINVGAFDSESFNSIAAERVLGIKDVTINPKLADEFVQAKTEAERAEALDAIYHDVADQVPATFANKFDAWRYTSMLFNPITHIKNILGNYAFLGERSVRNIMSASVQTGVNSVAHALGGKGFEQTRAIALTKADTSLIADADADYTKFADDIYKVGKFDDVKSKINDYRTIFGRGGKTVVGNAISKTVGVGVEKARTTNSTVLDLEDTWVSRPAYVKALASYLKANGVNFKTADSALLDRARAFAIDEAQKAAYRDHNAFSDWVATAGRGKAKNGVVKGVQTLSEGILPFRRTLANMFVRAGEYSPLGLAKTLTYDSVRLYNDDITPSEYIDNLSEGLTGTALFALGAFLRAQGIVSYGTSGDDKEDKLHETQGKQHFCLNVGGKSYTIDWLAPLVVPIFMGAALYDYKDDVKDGETKLEATLKLASNITTPMLELSMMSSLNDFIDGFTTAKQQDQNLIYYGIVQGALSYLGQAVPTIGGRIARTIDPTRRTSFTDPTSGVPADIQYFAQTQLGKIPFAASTKQPYVDQWGRTQESDSLGGRLLQNFLSPGYMKDVKVSDMEKEIERLHEDYGKENEVNVLPPVSVKKYFSNNGETIYMTADEYTQFKKTSGQAAYNDLTKLTSSAEYKAMSDADKAKAVSEVYSQSAEKAKSEVMQSRGDMRIPSTNDGKKIQTYVDAGVSEKQAYSIYKAVSDIKPEVGSSSVTVYQKVKAIATQGLTPKQQAAVVGTLYTSHDKDGNLTDESLLPYISNSARLLALYTTSKGENTAMINMTIPKSFEKNGDTYELTDAEKKLYKDTYIKDFNAHITSVSTEANVKYWSDNAADKAKNAVIKGR